MKILLELYLGAVKISLNTSQSIISLIFILFLLYVDLILLSTIVQYCRWHYKLLIVFAQWFRLSEHKNYQSEGVQSTFIFLLRENNRRFCSAKVSHTLHDSAKMRSEKMISEID